MDSERIHPFSSRPYQDQAYYRPRFTHASEKIPKLDLAEFTNKDDDILEQWRKNHRQLLLAQRDDSWSKRKLNDEITYNPSSCSSSDTLTQHPLLKLEERHYSDDSEQTICSNRASYGSSNKLEGKQEGHYSGSSVLPDEYRKIMHSNIERLELDDYSINFKYTIPEKEHNSDGGHSIERNNRNGNLTANNTFVQRQSDSNAVANRTTVPEQDMVIISNKENKMVSQYSKSYKSTVKNQNAAACNKDNQMQANSNHGYAGSKGIIKCQTLLPKEKFLASNHGGNANERTIKDKSVVTTCVVGDNGRKPNVATQKVPGVSLSIGDKKIVSNCNNNDSNKSVKDKSFSLCNPTGVIQICSSRHAGARSSKEQRLNSSIKGKQQADFEQANQDKPVPCLSNVNQCIGVLYDDTGLNSDGEFPDDELLQRLRTQRDGYATKIRDIDDILKEITDSSD